MYVPPIEEPRSASAGNTGTVDSLPRISVIEAASLATVFLARRSVGSTIAGPRRRCSDDVFFPTAMSLWASVYRTCS